MSSVRFGLFAPVGVGTHMIVLPELAAEIPGACEACFFRDGRDGFLGGVEQPGSLGQTILDQV